MRPLTDPTDIDWYIKLLNFFNTLNKTNAYLHGDGLEVIEMEQSKTNLIVEQDGVLYYRFNRLQDAIERALSDRKDPADFEEMTFEHFKILNAFYFELNLCSISLMPMQAPVFFVGECAYPHINLYDFKNLILYKLTKKKNVVAQENIVDENIIPVTVLFEAMKELSTNMPGEISPELADFLDKDFAISDVSALPSVEKQIDLWKFLDRSDEEKITNWINHVMKVVPLTWIGTGIHIYWQQGFYHFALGLIDLFPALNDLGPMANTIPCILWHLLGICVFDVEKNSSGLAQIYGTFFGFTMIYGASRMREFNLLSAFHKTPHYIKFIPPLITSLSNVFCSHTAKEMRQFWRNKLDPSVKPYLPEDINLIEEAIHAAGLKNK